MIRSLSLFLSLVFTQSLYAQEGMYRLRMKDHDFRTVYVKAVLPLEGGMLTIGGGHPEPNGERWGQRSSGNAKVTNRWSDYVEDLVLRTPDGELLEWKLSGNRWSVLGKAPETVHLSYRLLLNHDQVNWPPSCAEASYAREDCAYFCAYSAFVQSSALTSARVAFEVPSQWRVTTPLSRLEPGAKVFLAKDANQAYGTAFMVGEHQVAEVSIGNTQLEIGVTNELPGAIEVMLPNFKTALLEAREIFGGSPKQRYAILAGWNQGHGGNSGTGLGNGMGILLGVNPASAPGGIWSFVLIHELLHMWVGGELENRGSQSMEWFKEGFADYLTMLIGVRHGLIKESVRLSYMAQKWDGYLDLVGDKSLVEAGNQKSRHYDLLYGGGMHVAMLLDLEIRSATEGERSIDDLMSALNAKYGGESRTDIVVAHVESTASEIAGKDLGWIFDEFVHGKNPLLPELVYTRLGIEGARWPDDSENTRLALNPDAGDEQRALCKAIMGLELAR